jgi:hypothetical protein
MDLSRELRIPESEQQSKLRLFSGLDISGT